MIRFSLMLLFLLGTMPTLHAQETKGIDWQDIRKLTLEGQGWSKLKSPFDRLPPKAEKAVRGPVWGLSRHSAGICARFVTDARSISAKWNLTSKQLAMPHMPATGVSGVDLYVKTDKGVWRWLAVGRPNAQNNTQTLVSGLPPGKREYMLYLPLYNGVSMVEVGVPTGSKLTPAPSRPAGKEKSIVFYGTSITQGGCASRPGMVYTAIIGRHLDRPVINLGFSGNGRMEAEVARLMAEIDASVYVIDCLPNITASDVSKRTIPLVEILKKAHPETPILLVEDRSYTNAFLLPSKEKRNSSSRKALKAAYEKLTKDGVKNVHYLKGDHLLGNDGEGTVDSSHPTDLGFLRQARAFEEALQPLLK